MRLEVQKEILAQSFDFGKRGGWVLDKSRSKR